MPKQQDLLSDTFVEVHGVTIDQNFVHIGGGWNDGHVRESHYLLSSICSVHVRSYIFEKGVGKVLLQGFLALLVIAMTIPLIFLPKETLSDWLFYFCFLLAGLPFAWVFYVEIGTPAGKVTLTSFTNWIPTERRQRISYNKAKEVAEALMSRIG